MTRQEIFTKAWLGLKAQGFRRSFSKKHGCLYRGPDGLRCAIGHCIPDDQYTVDMEHIGAEEEIITRIIGSENGDFASDLQCCHDFASDDPADMEERLRSFAAKEGLTIPEAA